MERLLRNADTRKTDQIERLRFLGESLAPIGQGVIVVDCRGESVFANEAGQRLLQQLVVGSRPTAAQEATLRLRNPDGQAGRPKETALARSLRGETVVDLVTLSREPAGADLHFNVTASPVRDEHGRIIGAYALICDISDRGRAGNGVCQKKHRQVGGLALVADSTERKRVESAAGELAAIVQSSNDAIIGKTLEGGSS